MFVVYTITRPAAVRTAGTEKEHISSDMHMSHSHVTSVCNVLSKTYDFAVGI